MSKILDLYKNFPKNAKFNLGTEGGVSSGNQAVDFIQSKIDGEIAVKGFTNKAKLGETDFKLTDKILNAARKLGQIPSTKYSDSFTRE